MKILYASLTHGAPRVEWLTGALLLMEYEASKPDGGLIGSRHIAVGPYISRNRNDIVRKMYERDLDGTFMVDHDVYTPPETLEKMVSTMEETGAGVVAADLVLGSEAPSTAFMNRSEREFWIAERDPSKDWGRVQTIASSCVLVNRRVYEKIAVKKDDPPYFGPGTWWMHWPVWDESLNQYQELGEDFSFSRRVEEVGEMLVVRYGLDLGHWKVGRMVPHPRFQKELGNVSGD